MNPHQLFEAGKLSEALAAQNAVVKNQPTDLGQRTFLFELLCFQGDFERAERQLDVIGKQDVQRDPAAQAYRNLLAGERRRQEVFADGKRPGFLTDPPSWVDAHLQAIQRQGEEKPAEAKRLLEQVAAPDIRPCAGRLNGQRAFQRFGDCDEILAPLLELLIGPDYFWLPLEQVQRLEISPPKTPRDLIWAPCEVTPRHSPGPLRAHMPVLYNGSADWDSEAVQLGRVTEWVASPDGPVLGVGQRTFAVDEADVGMLEVREVNFDVNSD